MILVYVFLICIFKHGEIVVHLDIASHDASKNTYSTLNEQSQTADKVQFSRGYTGIILEMIMIKGGLFEHLNYIQKRNLF
jgi:hypothetical protein